MQIMLSGIDIGLALTRGDVSELMVVLAVIADADLERDGQVVDEIAARHNGTAYHAGVAPFLRSLADAIEGSGR